MDTVIRARTLRRDDWPALLRLMGPRGVGGGCWCQWARVPRGGRMWKECKGARNRRAFRKEIEEGAVHGSLAFSGKECVGWCRYGPTDSFPRLLNSPSLHTEPPRGTWSIVCFYVPARWRCKGVATVLLDHALGVMRKRRVRLVEAYPVPKDAFGEGRLPASFAWTGVGEMFSKAGFELYRRPGVKRQIHRRVLVELPGLDKGRNDP